MADPKIFKYKVRKNGKEEMYNIPENKLADFNLEFPEAEEIILENQKPISLNGTDSEIEQLYLDYNKARVFTEDENLLFERKPNTKDEEGNIIKGKYITPVNFEPYEKVNRSPYDERHGLAGTMETIIPYKDQLNQAKEMIENPQKYGLTWKAEANPNDETVQELASMIIKDEEKVKLLKTKTQNYLQTLTHKKRKLLHSYEKNKYVKNKNRFNELEEESNIILNEYSKSADLFNLKNIGEKIEDPKYQFDVSGLGDIELVEILAKRIKDMGNPEMLFTEASVDLYNNLIKSYNTEIEKVKTVKLNNGKIIPRTTFELFKKLSSENETVYNTLTNIEKEKENLPIDIKNSKQLLNYLNLNYSEIEKFGAK